MMKRISREDNETMEYFSYRTSWAPVPGFVLKTVLGEMADSLLLGGQRVIPVKLLESGYKFRFPKLPEALADIFRV